MFKMPTMMMPSQMAMSEVVAGIDEEKKRREMAAPVMAGEHGADVSTAAATGAPMIASSKALGGGGGTMAMLGGVLGGLSAAMPKQSEAPLEIDEVAIAPNPIRERALRGFRYGGVLRPGEEGIVGEAAPEHIEVRPDGQVEITPLEDDLSGTYVNQQDLRQLESIGSSAAAGKRYDPPSTRLELERTDTYGQPNRPMGTVEGVVGVSTPDGMAIAEEGTPLPPRRSVLDLKRIIANDPEGTGSDGVWKAREDVAREDAYRAMNEPVKKSFWKDLGATLLTAANNQLNNRQDPVRTWGEIQRDRKVGDVMPRLEMARKVREEDLKRRNTLDDNERQRIAIENTQKRAEEAAKAKVEAATTAFNRRIDFLKAQQDVRSGKATIYIDENGKVWRRFLQKNSAGELPPDEAVADPENPGQQDVDPGYRLFEVESPITGTRVKLRGRDLYSGESTVASRNTTIANDDIEDENERRAAIGTADAELAGIATEMGSLQSRNDALRQELAGLNPSDPIQRGRWDELQRFIAANDQKFFDLQGKQAEAMKKKDALSKPLLPRQRVGTPKYTESKIESVIRQ